MVSGEEVLLDERIFEVCDLDGVKPLSSLLGKDSRWKTTGRTFQIVCSAIPTRSGELADWNSQVHHVTCHQYAELGSCAA